MSDSATPNEAEQWRTSKLAEQSSELKLATDRWQGNNTTTLKALRGNPNAPADAVAAVNTILLAMYLVPEGMVLWHAEKAGLAINTVDWLPTSAVREGAEYWAARNQGRIPSMSLRRRCCCSLGSWSSACQETTPGRSAWVSRDEDVCHICATVDVRP
jgi:hypothetical protein